MPGGVHSSRETLYHIAKLNEQRQWNWEWVSKVACMCFSAINASSPAYLSELLHDYTPSRAQRSSSDTRMLKIQQYKRKTHGFRIFSCFGPHIWNSLPQDLRHCSTNTPSTAFRHLPPNSARFSYVTEGALFISTQLSSDAVSALRKFRVLIWL